MANQAAGIDDVDRALMSWMRNVLGDGVQVQLEAGRRAPSPPRTASAGVSLELFALAPAPPLRGDRRSPLQVTLRYRVTTWAEQPEAAHRLLSDLLFAALDRQDVEVDLAAGSSNDGVEFVIQIPLRRVRPEPRAPLVRSPPQVDAAPITPLSGLVLGPGDVPLAGALVEAPGLGLSSRTDHRGTFQLPGVPATARPIGLRVRARGTVHSFRVPASGGSVTVRVELPVERDLKEG